MGHIYYIVRLPIRQDSPLLYRSKWCSNYLRHRLYRRVCPTHSSKRRAIPYLFSLFYHRVPSGEPFPYQPNRARFVSANLRLATQLLTSYRTISLFAPCQQSSLKQLIVSWASLFPVLRLLVSTIRRSSVQTD